jgi:hypothetical protein
MLSITANRIVFKEKLRDARPIIADVLKRRKLLLLLVSNLNIGRYWKGSGPAQP